ncbi:fumarylacetoacetate hydrolase family protein [Curtobacterium flaccumfaciens pv. flaccumfaciens]|uniref:fumarylacetoacetate hydrolase family protein n=1 Tax=Curtobacterium flaccumfaciens TaxID=2035 RepID=UPI00217EC743|nr:fumarylacetoacetate hydrolase family protein [Curtobacterium flaccumfaciens]MCS6556509.1 fumarylacetoacetate hydrolase family protein [Curtobacterium flaccumfaciens]MCS6569488.1 fumarylacetoacetate hydrolase family protein [Curtobacterium flaccumfaciens pv. flaccumfaciens]MCS6583662.1 fumarylacetoacetate hydrolase family protein [Curtobacterium flaccumfaciens pv. flaccumfaciens]
MQFARLGPAGGEIPVAVDTDGEVLDLRAITTDIGGAFLASDPVARVRHARSAGDLRALPDAEGLRRGAPVARPGKVVCIGLNYRDHAAETGAEIPTEPIVFMKDPMTVIGPDDEVLIPRGSEKTDWEIELAVVIGQTARYCDSDEAASACIAGYAIANDVSERAFQLERGGQWDKGKSCETFNPLGPWLVTPDQVDPAALALRLTVNGEVRQDGTTADMIFRPVEIVRYLSQFMVLYPGDVISTGTPAGVALAGHAPYLQPGDVVELTADGLGSQRQTVGAA